MKVTLTGDLGSGKTTVAEQLAEVLKCRYVSSGLIFREIAVSKGITVLELNKLAEQSSEVDSLMDNNLKHLSTLDEDIVIDSRLGWYFIPESYKVYLQVDLNVAAKRILTASRGNVETYSNFEEAKEQVLKRSDLECERYKHLYGVDIRNFSQYDLVIDTSNLSVQSIVSQIKSKLEL